MKLPKTYDPSQYETDIYALWEKSAAFRPRPAGEAYCIVVPPPNANGNLHLGHGLTLALEDIAVRYHRLKGRRVLLLPGADHAGFETQVVYEKELIKQGKSRFDFTREELYTQIWDFVARNRQNFESQIRKLGAGVDWARFAFTLDEKIVKQAYASFRQMWAEGLIYRDKRLVNFCTFHGTAFADIEVAYKEEKGTLWYIRYPLVNGSGGIIVATTRPETMFGDTAVAVHPDDSRYSRFIGKTVKLPLTNREIPIIADDFVDISFGTGAVKLTPAHDLNDFEAGKRHSLPLISVIDHEGKMTHETPAPYRQLTVDDARSKTVAELEEQGLLVKTEGYTHNVGHCYKCDTIIQPLLREQWFVNMQPLAKQATAKLKAGKITFYPDSKREQLISYLEHLKDWNISRQIAWGIPIPAFQNVDNPEAWIYDERIDQEIIELDGQTYHRDPDVFDTWFSSSSWPFATLGYPDSQDFKDFYPLSLLETGVDILYPWVSRMLMLGLYATGEVPFKAVYLHGLIQDEHGAKMSKSKGNVIDPMEKVDEYGADAFRMGMIAAETAGHDHPYDQSKLIGARNFCNKLWNIARYIEALASEQVAPAEATPKSSADHWILRQLQQLQKNIGVNLDNYHFAEAYEQLYHFAWDDLANWYIEASKATPNAALLCKILENILVVAHPFAPFVTETIWQTLDWTGDSVLALQNWPTTLKHNNKKACAFADIQAIISEVRFITKTLGVTNATLCYTNVPFLDENAALIKRLARLNKVGEARAGTGGLYLVSTPYRCWLDVDQTTAAGFVAQLKSKLDSQQSIVNRLSTRLANKTYTDKAPSGIVEQTRQQLADNQTQLAAIRQEYERFKPTTC